MGLDPESAALMAADPMAPEVGPVAPAPVDQLLAGGPPPMPAGPDAISAAVTPEILMAAMQAAADELLGAAHAQLDEEHGAAREAAMSVVGNLMTPPDASLAQAGGVGPALPPLSGPMM
jgi:hypothetical protein